MDGAKSIYLANGDELILLDEQYYISHGGEAQPIGIDREEGESLIFETCHQMKMALEVFAEENAGLDGIGISLDRANKKIQQYEQALKTIALNGDSSMSKVAQKALMDIKESK